MSIAVRSPRSTDAETVAALLRELGYPADGMDVAERLEAFGRQHDAAIWVAEHDGDVAGLATAHVITSIHKPEPVAMLTVVNRRERSGMQPKYGGDVPTGQRSVSGHRPP